MSRSDFAIILNDSELPAAIRETIARAVKAAKVNASERCDLALEMIDHFRSGLAAETSEEELVRDFGDPKRAGRLMGRAARRKRPLIRRSLTYARRGVWGTAALILLLYTVVLVRYHAGEPNIARDYVAEWQADHERIPEDERAWPLYLRVAQESTDLKGLIEEARFDETQEEEDALRLYARSRPEILDLIRGAASKPVVGYPIRVGPDPELERVYEERDEEYTWRPIDDSEAGWNVSGSPMLLNVMLPYMQEMRTQSRLLVADARNALEEGDAQRFAANIEALVGMSEQVWRERTLVEQLVGISIGSLAHEELFRALTTAPAAFSAGQLRAMRTALEGARAGYDPIRLEGERDSFADIVQRVFTDDGNGDGRLTTEGMRMLALFTAPEFAGVSTTASDGAMGYFVLGPASTVVVAGRAETVEVYNRLMDLAQQNLATPLWEERTGSYDAELQRIVDSESLRYPVISAMMPAVGHVRSINDQLGQGRNAAVLALVIEEHRLRTGALPASLSELAVDARFTVDLYTGGSLLYTRSAGGESYTLYAVGVDYDDDGGTPAPGGNAVAGRYYPEGAVASWTAGQQAKANGDWVFVPAAIEEE